MNDFMFPDRITIPFPALERGSSFCELRSFHLFLLLELAHVQIVIEALFCK